VKRIFIHGLSMIKETMRRWRDDDVPRMAAALSYYTTFSLAPLLMLAIAVAGFVFGEEAARGQIMWQISGLVGAESARAIQSMIEAADRPAAGTLATIVGIVTLFLGASGVFGELRRGLNDVWDVEDDEGGLTHLIRQRARLFGMVLGITFLLMVSLLISAAISAFGKLLSDGLLPLPEAFFHFLDVAISFGLITLLFAALYRFLPRTRVDWRDTWIGAATTSFLFVAGKTLLGLYLGKSSVASSYGAAGSVLIVLLWVYYSGIIFYSGAEFTRVFADRHGSRSNRIPDRHPHHRHEIRKVGVG
jgi:membrane protein